MSKLYYDGKNHKFGKLIDGVLQVAPAELKRGYITNKESKYREYGYLPVIYAEKPEDTETGHYEAIYTETDGTIVQSWKFVSNIPPGFLDTSIITDWSEWFYTGKRKETIDYIDTSNGITFTSMFEGFDLSFDTEEEAHIPIEKINTSNGEVFIAFCRANTFITEIADFDTSKAKSLSLCFEECNMLQNAPNLNTAQCKSFNKMYYNCCSMVNGGIVDISSIPKEKDIINNASYMFANCSAMTSLKIKTDKLISSNAVRMLYYCTALTDFTVEGTIKVDDNSVNLAYCPNLTIESILSVLNALEDNTGEETQHTVYLGSSNLAKLSAEQKDIAYNKNLKLN